MNGPSARVLALMLCLVVSLPAASIASTIYVKYDAPGGDNGTSWIDAYVDLQSALAVADSSDTVLVAVGTYTPTPGTDRTATFAMETGVAVFGGFEGAEGSFAERDIRNHATILSGAIGGASKTDNSYHVVTAIGVGASAVLDGFYVVDGYAKSAGDLGFGGGVFCDGASPTLRNVQIALNNASNGGGMLCRNGSSPLMVNVALIDNQAGLGGAMLCQTSSPRLVNATVARNSATVRGGAFNHASSTLEAVNSVLWDNTAPTNPLTFNSGSGQPSFEYSLVQGSGGSGSWNGTIGADLGHNIDADAELADCGGSVRLASTSPAIDAGDGTVPELLSIDLTGEARVVGATVDMGAYEFSDPGAAVIYVDASKAVSGDGLGWSSAFRCMQEATALAGAGAEIWVKAGTYTPTDTGNRSAAFLVVDGVSWYGGFAGTETMRGERDPAAHITILSGEVGAASTADNTYHVIVADNIADTTTTIDGFTITRGNADASPGAGDNAGGGVLLRSCSALLNDLVIADNAAGYGGGIFARYGEPRVTNVRFDGNTAAHNGGGITTFESEMLVSGCTFDGNSAQDGGAGHVESYTGKIVTLEGCVFENNSAGAWGGALVLFCCGNVVDCRFENNTGDLGGAVLVNYNIGSVLSRSTFVGNSATGAGGGGSVYLRSAQTLISHCEFEGNSAASGGAIGGWRSIALDQPLVKATVIDCRFFDNHASQGGGAISIANGRAVIVNSSFFGCVAASGGAFEGDGADLELYNSILWGDSALSGAEIHHAGGIYGEITSSLIQGSNGSGGSWDTSLGTDLGGNIDADPFYPDAPAGDLHIGNGSPAVDAGTNAAPLLPSDDLDGNPRIVGVDVDMGAYEYDQVTSVDPPPVVSHLAIQSAYPNPFNPSVTVEISLDRRRPLSVDVYDVTGRLVRTLTRGDHPSGLNRVTWDGRNGDGAVVAAGVYFVSARSLGWQARRKIILVK